MRRIATVACTALLGFAIAGTVAGPAMAGSVQPQYNCGPCYGCC